MMLLAIGPFLWFLVCISHGSIDTITVVDNAIDTRPREEIYQLLVKETLEHCAPAADTQSLTRCRLRLVELIYESDSLLQSPRAVVESFRMFGGAYVSALATTIDSCNASTNYISSDVMLQFSAYGQEHKGTIENLNLVLCVSHFEENLGWLNGVSTPFVVASKTIRDSRILHVPINRGNEVSSYLLYIIELYDSLPVHTLFLHGHNKDWHQLYSVQYLLLTANLSVPYLSVNNFLVNDRNTSSNRYMQQLQYLWPRLFQDELGDMPPTFREKCCAQFVVHRDRIRLRSRAFYQRLYDYVVADDQDDAGTVDGYHTSMSYVVEFVWHYIFGEPAVQEYPNELYVQLTEDIIVYL